MTSRRWFRSWFSWNISSFVLLPLLLQRSNQFNLVVTYRCDNIGIMTFQWFPTSFSQNKEIRKSNIFIWKTFYFMFLLSVVVTFPFFWLFVVFHFVWFKIQSYFALYWQYSYVWFYFCLMFSRHICFFSIQLHYFLFLLFNKYKL